MQAMRSTLCTATVAFFALLAGVAWRWQRSPTTDALLKEAQRAVGERRVADADRLLRRALARDGRHSGVRLLLGRLARERSDWATVAAALQAVPDGDHNAAPARVVEGDAWLELRQAARSEDCWLRARRIAPEHRTARNRLLFLYAIQLRRKPWVELLWETYDDDQAGLREMIQLMIAGNVVWETHEAIETVQGFVAADPADVASRRALGLYLLRAGRTSAAAEQLETAVRARPDDVDSWLALAECQVACADAARARAVFDRVPTVAQADYRYWKHRGSWALLEGRHADAVADYCRALEGGQFDLELHHKLAQSLRFAGDPDGARRHAGIASTLARIERLCHALYASGATDLDSIRELVAACERLQLIEEARGWVNVGLARDPGDRALSDARQRLASLPATSSRRPPALETIP